LNSKLVVSSSPHLRTPETITSIMIDVIIALFPVALASVLIFGYYALVTIVVGVLAAMVTEAVLKMKTDIMSDGSAAVTGLLLALTLPPNAPLWIPAVGSACAILIAKHFFGGVGNNIFNPALVGRAILVMSWGTLMVGGSDFWPVPGVLNFSRNVAGADVETAATPLEAEIVAMGTGWQELLVGNVTGSLGETSAIAILIGAFWLFYKGHIDWRIPGGYIGTVFILGMLLGDGFYMDSVLMTGVFHVLAGGVMLGAFFMATDMVTSPVTPLGRLLFGVGCGVITMIIRLYGAYPEGVTFAILLMNAVTPIIDRYTVPKKFGEVKS